MASRLITIGEVELRNQTGRQSLIASQYYVAFSIGDVSRLTESARVTNGCISWDQIFYFDGDDRSVLLIHVYEVHRVGSDALVGSLADTVGRLSEKLRHSVLEADLHKDTSDGSDLARITIKFALAVQPHEHSTINELQDTDARSRVTIPHTLSPIRRATTLFHLATGVSNGVESEVNAFETTWGTLLQRMKLLNEVVGGIAEIRPYASLAWSVISATNQVLVRKKTCGDKIIRIAGTMSDAISFVHDDERLNAINEHPNIITALVKQVTECGYFITEYTKREFFWIRSGTYTSLDIDAIISHYEDKLRELQTALSEGVELRTGLVVARIMNDLVEPWKSIDLTDMPYGFGARFVREKGCLPGTRETLLREICDILNNPDTNAARVCLLTGAIGSGKSAVAHSIARLYDEQERLGSSYFFTSTEVAHLNTKNVLSTIARDLSDRDSQYKAAMWWILENDKELLTSNSPIEQMERLIIEPSESLHRIGPLVIVIDGLDDSSDKAGREQVLRTISDKISDNTLPMNLRFFITARLDSDILTTLPIGSQVVRKGIQDIPNRVVDADIERFFRHSLRQFTELDSFWPDGKWYRPLVQRSQRIFQWASTACSFIRGDDTAGIGLRERFEMLVRADKTGDGHPLDRLYRTILEQHFITDASRREFREVMGVVLTLREPLSVRSLSALFPGRFSARDIVQHLGSLLDGGVDEERPIRLLHSSFGDFLLDETRSSAFCVKNLQRNSIWIGRGLVRCMRNMLRFNMCDLQDAGMRNKDISDLADRVNRAIPAHLGYSCRYWMYHLQDGERTPELLAEVTSFFKDMFPYWLEAISLLSASPSLSSISSALDTCIILRKWAMGQEVSILASETIQFLQVFSPVLRESTPHLYISALSQIPGSSPLLKLRVNHLGRHILVTSGQETKWPVRYDVLLGHTSGINSIAYSPDQVHMVSGSEDNTLRIWDVITGQCIAEPLQGHAEPITCVAYSSCGAQIISGSSDKTIKIWDASTGQLVRGPLQGHIDIVSSLACSPDGIHLASGSWDKSIKIWNLQTGQCVGKSLQGHTNSVASIAYSPNGSYLASGSWDNTVRVWSPITSQCVAGPFQEHGDGVISVAYSPDGTNIVSGSKDKSIRIWNAITGQSITDPLQGHDDAVTSVAYSPAGTHIVSGSWDNSIRVWNASTGQAVAGPFYGHTHHITSVAYSPDGFHIVSGSWDNIIRVWLAPTALFAKAPSHGQMDSVQSVSYSPNGTYIASSFWNGTIKIWDATTGLSIASSFEGHGSDVPCVAWSPDGDHIVSGSGDCTIRIWSATTGESMIEPFGGHSGSVQSVAYSPDGIYVASGSEDETIRIWNATTGQCIVEPFQGHTGIVTAIAYAPNGIYIASGSTDHTIRVWNASIGQCVAGPFDGHTDDINTVAYSPDGVCIASGSDDSTIRVWDAATGHCVIEPLKGHVGKITSVAYSPDGLHIVSGSWDRSIMLWSATTGKCVAGPFNGHIMGINTLSYSPDGQYIVTGSGDPSIKVWRADQLLSFGYLSKNNSWIQSSDGSCLGWMAPWNGRSVDLPVHSLVIASDRIYQIQDSKSLFGKSWVSCWI